MNDLYKEILVKRSPQGTDAIRKAGMILLPVLFALAGFFISPFFLILAVAAAVLAWFVITGMNLEYEYLYVNGDIDVDRIIAKQKRKKAGSYPLENLELIAPTGSYELDSYKGKNVREIDYTSGDGQTKSYTAAYHQDDGTVLVRLELDDDLIRDLRRAAPRKVSREC